MVLSKRERVIRALERDDEPDIIPIQSLGFEKSSRSNQEFLQSDEYKDHETHVKNSFSNKEYLSEWDITEQRFWNADLHAMDPWRNRTKGVDFGDSLLSVGIVAPGPPEYPDSFIATPTGRIWKVVKLETGLDYYWYLDGVFRTPEILHSYWDEYGKPSEQINDEINYSPHIWDEFVENLSPYLYPAARSLFALEEAIIEGMTLSRVGYFMRKKPEFMHEVINEYTKANIEMIKRFAEAGVEIFFYVDDLGQKGRSILSLENFRKFILPQYKKMYKEIHKHGMFIVQHSCGYIDKLLPDMVDAGLDCIQTLEPTSGVDLAHLKEELGDRVSFMGGMDASRVLSFGTPKEVEEEVKRCVKAAGQGGGYFAGPSHVILDVPWENILAFRTAIEKYRKYPLRV